MNNGSNTSAQACIALSLIVFLGTITAFGIDRTVEASAIGENSLLSAFELRGDVKDETYFMSDEFIADYEYAARIRMKGHEAITEQELNSYRLIYDRMENTAHAANATIKLVGPSVQQETTTDSEGNFSFIGISKGVYELSAEAPSRTTPGRKAMGRMRYDFSPGKSGNWAGMEIHAFPVTVEGRVNAADGHPVADAKVTGCGVCLSEYIQQSDSDRLQEGLERLRKFEISTTTASDGTYKLEGFIPPDIISIAGYLDMGPVSLMDTAVPDSAFSRFYADIRVEVAGYTQRTVPRVPLVTENLLGPARRFLHMILQLSENPVNKETLTGFQEKGSVLPSQGDTIPNIDIVLDPVIAAESASQEYPSPPHTSDTHK